MTGARSRIEVLKSKGWRTAKIRKHTLGHWAQRVEGKNKIATNECRVCGGVRTCHDAPRPERG